MSKVPSYTSIAHPMPADLKAALISHNKALATWELATPLAQNEWVCWVISAKQQETRERRIIVALDKLNKGIRRPCCWAGCIHRVK